LQADTVVVSDVYGDGRHVNIDVVSTAFEGECSLQQQPWASRLAAPGPARAYCHVLLSQEELSTVQVMVTALGSTLALGGPGQHMNMNCGASSSTSVDRHALWLRHGCSWLLLKLLLLLDVLRGRAAGKNSVQRQRMVYKVSKWGQV
jgi:stress-induced morphogen